jgi:hypothetical protein
MEQRGLDSRLAAKLEMVSITPTTLLGFRVRELRDVLRLSFGDAGLQSRGFAARIVPLEELRATDNDLLPDCLDRAVSALPYGGVPAVAAMGFALGGCASEIPEGAASAFVQAVGRLRGRSSAGHVSDDDIAVLGIADGLSRIRDADDQVAELGAWLISLVDSEPHGDLWSARMRPLAVDLLDDRGRLRASPDTEGCDPMALEICLRQAWPSAFRRVGPPNDGQRRALMADLLSRDVPMPGELDRAAVWLSALRALVGEAAAALVPAIEDVVRALRATQGGLKRWVWEQKRGRRNTMPAKWLIDDEPHVQAFLWAALYPMFGGELRDEQYLPGYGQLQPRYDFRIANLKVIVEVKFLREKADFRRVEEEVAADLGIYFSDPERFDRIITYVYDDCDVHQPELYDGLRNALLQRDSRIVDVVFVRRPSMIPGRRDRV